VAEARKPIPSAPLAAGLLIVSYGVVAASGSRALGGVVLLAGAAALGWLWRARHGARAAARLLAIGFAAFVASHLIALALGAWPAVLIAAAAMAGATWALTDSRPAARREEAEQQRARDRPGDDSRSRSRRAVRAIRRPAR